MKVVWNYFLKSLPFIWGFVSIGNFGFAGIRLKLHRVITEEHSDEYGYVDDEAKQVLDQLTNNILKHVFLGIAAGVQAIPDHVIPKRPISRNIYLITRMGLGVGFFIVALPSPGWRNNNSISINNEDGKIKVEI